MSISVSETQTDPQPRDPHMPTLTTTGTQTDVSETFTGTADFSPLYEELPPAPEPQKITGRRRTLPTQLDTPTDQLCPPGPSMSVIINQPTEKSPPKTIRVENQATVRELQFAIEPNEVLTVDTTPKKKKSVVKAQPRIRRDVADDDNEEEKDEIYETIIPYPRTPVEMNWSYEMSTRVYEEDKKVYAEIGDLLTQLIDTLSFGDPKKKQQLTLMHSWVPFKKVHCFDSLRLMLSMYCVEWKLSEFARKYGYVLVNMCNAKWLTEEDIEEGMARTCENKRIPDDKCM